MGRIQDKRDREREAIYNQYVVYSKTASKLLLALVSVALYIGYTIYENSNAVEGIEQQVKDEVLSTYGPFNSALYESQVSHTLDTLKYELPIVQRPIGNREFFIVAPTIFFLLTWFYWLYLNNSLRQFRVLRAYLGHRSPKSYSYPWLYWLPWQSVTVRISWQMLLELAPVAFLAFLLITFLFSREYYTLQAVLCVGLLAIPLVIHIYLFDIRFKGKEAKELVPLMILLLALALAVSLAYKVSLMRSLAEYFLYPYIVIGLVDYFLFGQSIILISLIFMPVYVVPWQFKRRKWENPGLVLLNLWSREPIGGYFGYFRDRYHELKRMQ